MKYRKKVFFLNDKSLYNERYRSSLISLFLDNGFEVRSLALFPKKNISFLAVLKLMSTCCPVVSSNIRSNIIFLCVPWLSGMVILNGLGRHRSSRFFRWVIGVLIKLNVKKNIAVQSYADYRYFRRFFLPRRIRWFPGSGGSKKIHGERSGYLLVQRDDKLPLVAPDLNRLFSGGGNVSVSVVGCKNESYQLKCFDFFVDSLGFVDSSEILRYGKTFVQPSGYGEGFPHSLADAIVSHMDVLISKNEYIRSGLWRIGAERYFHSTGWFGLVYGDAVIRRLSSHQIAMKYFDFFSS